MNQNTAKKRQGPIDSLSRPWKQSLKRNTRKKSHQRSRQRIEDDLIEIDNIETQEQIKRRVEKTLQLQEIILKDFFNSNIK